ncbi:unnamed protein product, partial [Prorocentrum cordatum]
EGDKSQGNRVTFLHVAPSLRGMDPAVIRSAAMEEEKKDQLIACSIAEGCALYCSEDPGYVALFAAAAYFNHSCAPNASVESTRSELQVRAAADIPRGTEVTISYLPSELLDSAEGRRRRLDAGRGFHCLCTRCREEGLVVDEP